MEKCVQYKKRTAVLFKILVAYIIILLLPILIDICYGTGVLLGTQVRNILNCL